MSNTTIVSPLPTTIVTVDYLKAVWLNEETQGWHVHGTIRHHTTNVVENWGAAVDDVGNPLVKRRWLDMTKGHSTPEDERAVLDAIERAIIMTGADLEDEDPRHYHV